MGRSICGDIEGRVWDSSYAAFNHFGLQFECNRYFTQCGEQCCDDDADEGDPCAHCTREDPDDEECVLGDAEELLFSASVSDIPHIQQCVADIRKCIITNGDANAEQSILAIENESEEGPYWVSDNSINRIMLKSSNDDFNWEGFVLGTQILRCLAKQGSCCFCVDL